MITFRTSIHPKSEVRFGMYEIRIPVWDIPKLIWDIDSVWATTPPQQRVDFRAGIYKKTIYLFTRSENNAESDNFGRMIMLNTNSSNLAWTLGRNINLPLVR